MSIARISPLHAKRLLDQGAILVDIREADEHAREKIIGARHLALSKLDEANLALPEGQPYPRLYQALDGLLDAIEAAPSAKGWAAAMVRYELLLLSELGFGLDLERCAVSGSNDNLVAVSPKTGRAVSAAEAEPYAGKLLSLPTFVREGGRASWEEIAQGLALTGHFLMRDVVTDRSRPIGDARERLVDRLRRAGGLA